MSPKIQILMIDDDVKLTEILAEYLRQFGYLVQGASHPERGIAMINKIRPELVILDVMLPDKDGFTVCRELRATSQIPIIMLSARGEVTDRIVGLEMGADDYLAKPFEPRELLARIQSILRRKQANYSNSMTKIGELVLDMDKRSVKLQGEDLELTTAEFEVLALLMQNPERVFNRDQISDALKGSDWVSFDRSVDVLISRLRQKLKDSAKKPKYLKTIWGTGYKFIGT
ncbi:MAG: response regulator transcription factor [Oligoflexales bacterium]